MNRLRNSKMKGIYSRLPIVMPANTTVYPIEIIIQSHSLYALVINDISLCIPYETCMNNSYVIFLSIELCDSKNDLGQTGSKPYKDIPSVHWTFQILYIVVRSKITKKWSTIECSTNLRLPIARLGIVRSRIYEYINELINT